MLLSHIQNASYWSLHQSSLFADLLLIIIILYRGHGQLKVIVIYICILQGLCCRKVVLIYECPT